MRRRKYPWHGDERYLPTKQAPWYMVQENISRYVFASQFAKDRTTLDVGCGTGYGTAYLKRKGASLAVGADISAEALEYARTHFQRPGVVFARMDAERLPFCDDVFDLVVCLEVIEHLATPEKFLQDCQRVLRQDGILVCSTPNKDVVHPRHEGTWSPYHIREYPIEEFRGMLECYFSNVSLYGLGRGSMRNSLPARLAAAIGPLVFLLPKPQITVNVLTRIALRRYRIVTLGESDLALETIVEESYRPYPLGETAVSPVFVLALAQLGSS